jgi:hypothetical protein
MKIVNILRQCNPEDLKEFKKYFQKNETKTIFNSVLSSRFVLFNATIIIYILISLYYVGIIIEYELRDKTTELKEIDLLHLTPE